MLNERYDYRTREGREAEVLAQFEIDGYLDSQWASDNSARLAAALRLLNSGVIPSDKVRDDIVRPRKRDESLLSRGARLWDGFVRALFGGQSI